MGGLAAHPSQGRYRQGMGLSGRCQGRQPEVGRRCVEETEAEDFEGSAVDPKRLVGPRGHRSPMAVESQTWAPAAPFQAWRTCWVQPGRLPTCLQGASVLQLGNPIGDFLIYRGKKK